MPPGAPDASRVATTPSAGTSALWVTSRSGWSSEAAIAGIEAERIDDQAELAAAALHDHDLRLLSLSAGDAEQPVEPQHRHRLALMQLVTGQ